MLFSLTSRGRLQAAAIALLGGYVFFGAFDTRRLWLIDGANLLFHEAGHLFFAVFGEFTGFLGGTLMQLLMPLAAGLSFISKRQFYSASVMGLWFAENFFGISVYIRDARAQVLPLVGGEVHDWGWLLGRMQLLESDQVIGHSVWIVGAALTVAAVYSGIYFSERNQNAG